MKFKSRFRVLWTYDNIVFSRQIQASILNGERNLRAVYSQGYLVTDLGELWTHLQNQSSLFRVFNIGTLWQPCWHFRPRRNWAEKEWSNGTEFSGYSYFPEYWDKPGEVHLKFRNKNPENVFSIRSSHGISGIFGRMESASGLWQQMWREIWLAGC